MYADKTIFLSHSAVDLSKALLVHEIVSNFKYLGVLFNGNGSFTQSKQQQITQTERAIFSFLNKCKKLGLHIDVQLELFDRIVVPISYSIATRIEYVKTLEIWHFKFGKYILNVKKITPKYMVYGEFGRVIV